MTGTAELGIEDGRKKHQPLMSHVEDPPPPPEIHSSGVIATDITSNFVKAAQSISLPKWERKSRD